MEKVALLLDIMRSPADSQSALLKERHEDTPLEGVTSWEALWEADYFLFLRGQLKDSLWNQRTLGYSFWPMWTALHVGGPASWVARWKSANVMMDWLPALGFKNISEVKALITQRQSRLDPKLLYNLRGTQIRPEQIDT